MDVNVTRKRQVVRHKFPKVDKTEKCPQIDEFSSVDGSLKWKLMRICQNSWEWLRASMLFIWICKNHETWKMHKVEKCETAFTVDLSA